MGLVAVRDNRVSSRVEEKEECKEEQKKGCCGDAVSDMRLD